MNEQGLALVWGPLCGKPLLSRNSLVWGAIAHAVRQAWLRRPGSHQSRLLSKRDFAPGPSLRTKNQPHNPASEQRNSPNSDQNRLKGTHQTGQNRMLESESLRFAGGVWYSAARDHRDRFAGVAARRDLGEPGQEMADAIDVSRQAAR